MLNAVFGKPSAALVSGWLQPNLSRGANLKGISGLGPAAARRNNLSSPSSHLNQEAAMAYLQHM